MICVHVIGAHKSARAIVRLKAANAVVAGAGETLPNWKIGAPGLSTPALAQPDSPVWRRCGTRSKLSATTTTPLRHSS